MNVPSVAEASGFIVISEKLSFPLKLCNRDEFWLSAQKRIGLDALLRLVSFESPLHFSFEVTFFIFDI